MAWRTINNPGSRLQGPGLSTGSCAIMYARRQVTDLNADTAEVELQGSSPSRIAGIVSSGNGTDFYGHATVGETWVGDKTGYVASTVNQWGWRLIVGNGTSLRFFSAPDNASSAWTEWPDSPLTQTVFAADLLALGGNGREGAVIDYAAIRAWNVPKTPANLVAERAAPAAIDETGLVLDKLGIGESLAASLAAGTGTLTTAGTVTLNAELPSAIVTEAPPATTPVTVGGALQADPLVTVEASSAGDTVSFSGEYSSIGTPTITVTLHGEAGENITLPAITGTLQVGETLTVSDGEWSTVVDTKTPTGADGEYSGSFTGVADGTYTVEASITDDATSGGTTAVTDSLTVDDEVVPPDAPTALAVTAYTTTTVSLSWTDGSASDAFEVQRLDPLATEAAATTSLTWTGLSPNTAYSFRVRAQKDGLWSEWSSAVAQATAPAAPGAPTVIATTLSDSAIRLDWLAVDAATEYRAYRKASPGGQRTLIYTGSALTYTDTELAEGSLFYYDVAAANVSGATFSAETNATTLQSDGPGRLIVRAPERIEAGRELEVIVQAVTGRGDPIIDESVTITPSLTVTGTLSGTTDVQGYAEFLLTPTEAGTLSILAAIADASSTVTVEVVEPGTEDSATIAARLAAAEKKSTRTTPKPSPPPLESSAPPLALIPEASVSPLAALLNEMLLAPQPVIEPISLSGFMPPPQAAPPPSNGTQRAIEALDQAIAAQMQTLHQQLETLNKLIE